MLLEGLQVIREIFSDILFHAAARDTNPILPSYRVSEDSNIWPAENENFASRF